MQCHKRNIKGLCRNLNYKYAVLIVNIFEYHFSVHSPCYLEMMIRS